MKTKTGQFTKMWLQRLASLEICILTCVLQSCSVPLDAVVYNNTKDPVELIVDIKYLSNRKHVIRPKECVQVEGLSTVDFTIQKGGKIFHYMHPLNAMTVSYKGSRNGHDAFFYQFENDNKIYLLQPSQDLPASQLPSQPLGFPIAPNFSN